MKSWLSFNNITLGERRINFTDADDTPTLREEKAPEPDELRKALEHACPRTRAAMALSAFCGFRPVALARFCHESMMMTLTHLRTILKLRFFCTCFLVVVAHTAGPLSLRIPKDC
jgi:hypothetical protein